MPTKTAYSYDAITFEYKGETVAYPDPVETEKQGTLVYALPAYCTFVPPAATEENQAAVFSKNENLWHIVSDMRGKAYWKKSDSSKIIVDTINYVPSAAEYTDIPPTSKYHRWDIEQSVWQYTEVDEHLLDRWSELEKVLADRKSALYTYNIFSFSLDDLEAADHRALSCLALMCDAPNTNVTWSQIEIADVTGNIAIFPERFDYINFISGFYSRNALLMAHVNTLRNDLKELKDMYFITEPETAYTSIRDFDIFQGWST